MLLPALNTNFLRGTNGLLTLFAATALLVAVSIPSQAAAPHNKHMSMAKPGTPIQLVPEALGTYEWQISTDSPEAQAFSIRACSYGGLITCLNLWPPWSGHANSIPPARCVSGAKRSHGARF